MKINNKGFGVIEGILIVAIIGLLGFVGFKAYQNYTADDADNSAQVTKSNNKTRKEDEKNSKLMTYTNQAAGFSFDYPKEWGEAKESVFEESQKGTYLLIGFANNKELTIGGNGSDYTSDGRGLSPLDDPGFIGGSGSYKTPGKFTESKPLDVVDTVKTKNKGDCVYVALVGEMGEAGSVVYRCNISKGVYYGLNFALDNPTETSKSALKSVVESLK